MDEQKKNEQPEEDGPFKGVIRATSDALIATLRAGGFENFILVGCPMPDANGEVSAWVRAEGTNASIANLMAFVLNSMTPLEVQRVVGLILTHPITVEKLKSSDLNQRPALGENEPKTKWMN